MTVNRTCVSFAVTVVALFALSMQAQDRKQRKEDASMRLVQGIVLDADDKPVVGAVVQLKDMRTLQVRSFITLEDGKYHFSGLKIDNDYQLKADHSGMTSGWKTLSVFDSRKVPVINLKMDKKIG